MSWLEPLIQGLYPGRCGGCGGALPWRATTEAFCDACAEGLLPIGEERCPRCGVPWQQAATCPACRATPPEWVALRSVYQYGGPLREALHAFKFERRTHLYRPLGLDLARLAEREGWAWDALAAVPMTDKALRQRGHNPAFLLARGLARALGVPGPDARALGKCRETAPQRSLGAAERQANVKGAFEAQVARISGRSVLLVDDVVTTGATLGACARALLQAGATEVRALTLARRVLE